MPDIKFLSDLEFHKLAKTGKTQGFGVRKYFIINEKEISEEERVIEFTNSTLTEDRSRDTIDQIGWRLDNFRKNPVVLWAHDYAQPPVAKSLSIWIEDGKLKSKDQFTPKEIYPFGYMVYELYKNGFLNAKSVGFQPIEYIFNDETDGVDYKVQELLEHSCVPVPANPEALVSAKSMGIDLLPLKSWAEEVLDTWNEEKGIWIPKEDIETVFSLLSGKSYSIPGKKKSICGSKSLPTASEDTEWDAREAESRVREWAGGDNIDWDKYQRAFVWVDSEAGKDKFTSYKLPFADVIDGKLSAVWRAVAVAMAAVLGARGGIDIPEADRKRAYNFLSTYYEKFDKPVPGYKSIVSKPEGGGWDETENSWRYRVRDPEDFIQDSFRTKEIDTGVKAVFGKLKVDGADGPMKTQTIIFNKETFPNKSDAQKWLNEHEDLTKEAEYVDFESEIRISDELMDICKELNIEGLAIECTTPQELIRLIKEEIAHIKSGRVLSEKNRNLIQSCMTQMQEAISALDKLLQMTEPQSEEESKEITFDDLENELQKSTESTPDDEEIDLDSFAIEEKISLYPPNVDINDVREIIRQTVKEEMRRLTGKLD